MRREAFRSALELRGNLPNLNGRARKVILDHKRGEYVYRCGVLSQAARSIQTGT